MKALAIIGIALAVSVLIVYILNEQGVFTKKTNGNGTKEVDLSKQVDPSTLEGKEFTI